MTQHKAISYIKVQSTFKSTITNNIIFLQDISLDISISLKFWDPNTSSLFVKIMNNEKKELRNEYKK